MTDLTPERPHELETYFEQDMREMASEYERIHARTTQDPGTAGDEGEEVWADLLRQWFPESYRVVTKGRVLGADGTAGPQVDVIVLRPGYPTRLINKKLYLSDGVAAVFECKNTLIAGHVSDSFGRSRRTNSLTGVRPSTPFGEMVSSIPYGLLAHSHSWKLPDSRPMQNVDNALVSAIAQVARPSDPPSLVCVADLGCWSIGRNVYDGPGLMPPDIWAARQKRTGLPERGAAWIGYFRHTDSLPESQAPMNPIAVAVASILGRLAHDDATARPLCRYFAAAGVSGSSQPIATKVFSLDTLSEELRAGLPRRLTNGIAGSDWQIMYMY
jgi:hypothetical protein